MINSLMGQTPQLTSRVRDHVGSKLRPADFSKGVMSPGFPVEGWSAYPPRLSVIADIPARRPSAIGGPSALQQTAYLLAGLPNLHNPRHSDCKGRTLTFAPYGREPWLLGGAESRRTVIMP